MYGNPNHEKRRIRTWIWTQEWTWTRIFQNFRNESHEASQPGWGRLILPPAGSFTWKSAANKSCHTSIALQASGLGCIVKGSCSTAIAGTNFDADHPPVWLYGLDPLGLCSGQTMQTETTYPHVKTLISTMNPDSRYMWITEDTILLEAIRPNLTGSSIPAWHIQRHSASFCATIVSSLGPATVLIVNWIVDRKIITGNRHEAISSSAQEGRHCLAHHSQRKSNTPTTEILSSHVHKCHKRQ